MEIDFYQVQQTNNHNINEINLIANALSHVNKSFVYVNRLQYESKEFNWLERTFSFEFYHQLRKIFKNKLDRYKIQGEIEKSSHKSNIGNIRPDFIFHIPGDDDFTSQYIHLELKVIKNKSKKWRETLKDLERLCIFQKNLKYQYSIEIIIGTTKTLDLFKKFLLGDLVLNNSAPNFNPLRFQENCNFRNRIIKTYDNKIFILFLDVKLLEN